MVLPVAAAPAGVASCSLAALLSADSLRLRLGVRRRRRRLSLAGMQCLLALSGCACLLLFFLDASIYSALDELLGLLRDRTPGRQLHLASGALDRPPPGIVIFAAPHPFSGFGSKDSVEARQDVAVRSWLALSPEVSVVLFGQHPSIFAFARSLGPRVAVESAVDFTFTGTPFLHSMVARTQSLHSGISVLIDPETILLPDFLGILHYAQTLKKDWFLVSKPHHVADFPFRLVGNGKNWLDEEGKEIDADKLQEHLAPKPNWCSSGKRLVMAWNNNGAAPLHSGILPPFVYGEGPHNEWIVNEVLASEFRLALDSSLVFSSVHPEGSGRSAENFREDAESNADAGGWMHRGNNQLSGLYGSLSFRRENSYSNLIRISKCFGEYYLADEEEDDADSLGRSDGKLQLFKGLVRSLAATKWEPCAKHIGELDVSYRSSIMELRGAASETPSALSLTLPFSLEQLLRVVADKDSRTIVLAVAGESYRDMLMNWVCRLRNLQVRNFLVCALDSETHRFSILQGLPVFKDPLAPSNISFSDCHFGTKCFQRVTKVKSRIVLQILKMGYNVLLSDVDVYWFKNPLPLLMSFGPGALVAQSDEYNSTGPINMPRRLNSGFYFARSDSTTVAAMEMVVQHASASELSEQPSFYDVLCGRGGANRVGGERCREPSTNLTVMFLDRNLFPNGAYRGLWEKRDEVRSSCAKLGCYVLHNNWISGRQRKLDRQVLSGLWDYDPSSRMCLQGWHADPSN